MTTYPRAPRRRGADPDTDPRSPGNLADGDAAIVEVQPIAKQVETILGERDAHRHRQVARTAAQVVNGKRFRIDESAPSFHCAHTPAAHHRNAFERIEGADQNRGRRAV